MDCQPSHEDGVIRGLLRNIRSRLFGEYFFGDALACMAARVACIATPTLRRELDSLLTTSHHISFVIIVDLKADVRNHI